MADDSGSEDRNLRVEQKHGILRTAEEENVGNCGEEVCIAMPVCYLVDRAAQELAVPLYSCVINLVKEFRLDNDATVKEHATLFGCMTRHFASLSKVIAPCPYLAESIGKALADCKKQANQVRSSIDRLLVPSTQHTYRQEWIRRAKKDGLRDFPGLRDFSDAFECLFHEARTQYSGYHYADSQNEGVAVALPIHKAGERACRHKNHLEGASELPEGQQAEHGMSCQKTESPS